MVQAHDLCNNCCARATYPPIDYEQGDVAWANMFRACASLPGRATLDLRLQQ